MINVFDETVGETHPEVAKASPSICTLHEGDALLLPKGWHHAVISTAQNARNLAVNTWYDLERKDAAPAVSSLESLFQSEGCS